MSVVFIVASVLISGSQPEQTCHPGDICQHLETCGVVTTGGLLLASGRSRGQGHYQTPYETQHNPQQQRFICPKMSKTLVDKLFLMTLNKFFFLCNILYSIIYYTHNILHFHSTNS